MAERRRSFFGKCAVLIAGGLSSPFSNGAVPALTEVKVTKLSQLKVGMKVSQRGINGIQAPAVTIIELPQEPFEWRGLTVENFRCDKIIVQDAAGATHLWCLGGGSELPYMTFYG